MENAVISRIKEYMESLGMSIKDIAQILSVDRNTVSSYLASRQKLKLDQLILLAQAFRISPCAFFMDAKDYELMSLYKERLDEKDKLLEDKDRMIENLLSITQNLDTAIKALMNKNG